MYSLWLVGLLGNSNMEQRLNQEYDRFLKMSLDIHNKGFELTFEHSETDTSFAWQARFFQKKTEAILLVYYPVVKSIIQTNFEGQDNC